MGNGTEVHDEVVLVSFRVRTVGNWIKLATSGPCEAHLRAFYLRTDGAERRPLYWHRVCIARALASPCLSCTAQRCRTWLV